MSREHGSKPGSGGVAGKSEAQLARKERLRQLATDTIDLDKDPYFMRNHLGRFECKLCLTLHLDEASYLTHTQGKKHQTNLARRAARESARYMKKSGGILPPISAVPSSLPAAGRRDVIKIGRPAYKITKIKDPETRKLGLLFQIHYPQIDQDSKPMHRFMSAYEQRQEQPADPRYQYLLFAADPYETIAIKVPNHEIDTERMVSFWDQDAKILHFQMIYAASLNMKSTV